MSASTATVAKELVACCLAGKNIEAIDKLYSPNIVSIEPVSTAALPATMTGIDAVRAKNQWWIDNNEVHAAEANGPFIADKQFVVHYKFDTTSKASGARMQMAEMALYTVKDGKIVQEEFFYNMPGA